MTLKNKNKFVVDFVGIGASRSGTTWISKCLAEHPEICFSNIKETHFFHDLNNYSKGLFFYKKFYSECKSNKVKGEFTPGYFAVPGTANRIHTFFPDTKIITCLRNPTNRAYSEYFYNIARGLEDNKSFEGALDGKLKNRYHKRGKYHSNLLSFFEKFPKENILVLFFEDIKKNPLKFIQNIYKFLNINPSYVPKSYNSFINTSPVKEALYFPLYTSIINNLKSNQNYLFKNIKKITNIIKLNKFLNFLVSKNYSHKEKKMVSKPSMKKETKKMLDNKYLKENTKLKKLLGKIPSSWSQ